MAEAPRRRRRVRQSGSSGATATAGAPVVADAVAVATAETTPVADEPALEVLPVEPDVDAGPSERGLRGLVGGGSSQIKPAAAMRARDASRPRPEDLERAEADLTIVRRHWQPRD